ncbi:ABC transporter, ATP binding protein [Bifidobacterium ramosum]|uniref:ABC transporter, ATP binding protein n=1 Tax=Bifidobacterium ramosum TaxID=1798158 RepID=A0A6L4X236_9BIFI|nr:ATP-binding cassette domain-containing protein [Bifidobacterium ramosum]KAB8288930.1 ABC transporter, ATP binding protein [Bifidobacterium ramosum]NEG70648.1 ATP-binding cassette domain-containing protein [Bifidobacterium ramosum]
MTSAPSATLDDPADASATAVAAATHAPTEPIAPVAVRARDWGWRHSTRRDFALRHVDFDIRPGEHVLLLGASGAGKSTLMAALAGVLGGDDEGEEEGSLTLDGVEARDARGRAGLVLQDPDSQIILERVGDDAAFGCENLDVPRDETWRRVRESLGIVGLGDLDLTRSTAHLSGGQRQRLALAGVLAMHPGLLLLDEPTANLDPEGVREVHDAVRDVLAKTGETMVVVEHHIDVWLDLIDRVIVLGRPEDGNVTGGVIADGTPNEVFSTMGDVLADGGAWVPGRAVPTTYRTTREAYGRAQSGKPLLIADDLSFGRGTPLGEHANLAFRGGEVYALMGPNGAGKSTMALTLAGLLRPLAGHVRVSADLAPASRGASANDEPVHWRSRELLGRVGMVFQEPEHQFVTNSVRDEVALGPKGMGAGDDEAYRIADDMLERLGLARFAKANPYTLSGGEKRRLSVASMLAAAPKVLIMDEPTFGQDFTTWTEMVRLIAIARDEGSAVIMVTHDEPLVDALGATRVRFEAGEMRTDGDVPREPAASVSSASVPSDSAVSVSSATDAVTNTATDAVAQIVRVSPQSERHEPAKPASPSWFIARINPVSRFVMGLILCIPMFFSLDVVSATTALGIELALLWIGGVNPIAACRKTWPVWIAAAGGFVSVFLYGKASGATLLELGVIHVTEGSVYFACATFLRVLAIAMPGVILALGLDPTDLADGLVQLLHLSPRFVYGGLAGMRMFTLLQEDWRALGLARRSRGLGDEGAVKRALSQAFGLLVLSIRRATKLATAMEARGFGGSGPRSQARVSSLHAIDVVGYAIAVAVPTIALTAAVLTGYWNQPLFSA